MKYPGVERARNKLVRLFPEFDLWLQNARKGREADAFNYFELLPPFFLFVKAHFDTWPDQQKKLCFDYVESVLCGPTGPYVDSMELYVVHDLGLIDDRQGLSRYLGERTARIYEVWRS